jgi:hypothetical protein
MQSALMNFSEKALYEGALYEGAVGASTDCPRFFSERSS